MTRYNTVRSAACKFPLWPQVHGNGSPGSCKTWSHDSHPEGASPGEEEDDEATRSLPGTPPRRSGRGRHREAVSGGGCFRV
ncbi:unnamed protein product [Arctogadus glacialis]